VMPKMPGNIIVNESHEELKDYLLAILDWVEETGADQESPLKGKADAELVGLSGHSLGGKISLMASAEDERPKASFVLDPVDSAAAPIFSNPDDYPSVTPEKMPQITVPLGLVGETLNGVADEGFFSQACAPEEDNFHQYYLFAESPAIEIEVLGANHMSFLDNPECGFVCSVFPKGTDDPATTRQLARKYMTAFYNYKLLGLEEYKLYLAGAYMWDDMLDALVMSETKNDF